jgi:hypothetical protein
MSTPISEFRDPVRCFLQDNDDTILMYEDGVVDRGVRTLIRCGLVAGFSLDAANNITPTVTEGRDFLLIAARTALNFAVGNPDRQGVRMRAFSENVGNFKELVEHLRDLIYKTESGDMAMGWQSFASFVEGYSGVRKPWAWLARFELNGPFLTVSLGQGGFSS